MVQPNIDDFYKKTKKYQTMAKRSTRKRKSTTRSKSRVSTRVKRARKSKRRYRFKKARKYGTRKVINIKEDREGYVKGYLKQKVTRQQQKLINRRFKNGYSSFSRVITENFQDTLYNETDKCKWIWSCHNTFNDIVYYWEKFPAVNNAPTNTVSGGLSYFYSGENTIYLNKVTYKYDIFNPTDYDMNLIIYDVVCKLDTDYEAASFHYNFHECDTSVYSASQYKSIGFRYRQDPIHCIYQGTRTYQGYLPAAPTIQPQLFTDATAKEIYDVTLKPTESYPFNIYWKIVKKYTLRLQPGATLTHKFTHKPKCLLNRGYFFTRYRNQAQQVLSKDGLQDEKLMFACQRNTGLKDITSGCLFKYWGQVAGSGDSGIKDLKNDDDVVISKTQEHTQTTTLSGRIMMKKYITTHWQTMDQKSTYTFKDETPWVPADEEDLEVVNTQQIKVTNATDLIKNNDPNNGQQSSSIQP